MHKSITYRCMKPGCRVEVSGQRLMCGFHWGSVPPDVQTRVRAKLLDHDRFVAAQLLSDFLDSERFGKEATA